MARAQPGTAAPRPAGRGPGAAASHRSSATPLALVAAALIVYASLYPFEGWRLPSVPTWYFLTRPWPRWWTWFDLIANLLGYLPFGALVFAAMVRSGHGRARAFVGAGLIGAALSLTMETLQVFLPQRVPSNVDLALNTAGSVLGAVVGAVVHGAGGIERWQAWRERWFIAHSAGALALLVLWPIALLFPTPVPLGIGQVLPPLRNWLAEALLDTPYAAYVVAWVDAEDPPPLSPASEFSTVALGLLAPCLIAYAATRPGWRRVVLALGAAALGVATTTLATALNFGPQHALAWRTTLGAPAMIAATVVALLLAWVPRRAAAGLGLLVLGALVALVAQAPTDPYFAETLQAWEQGRFIRLHGAARWIGWFWPFAAMAYLLARIGAREPRSGASVESRQ